MFQVCKPTSFEAMGEALACIVITLGGSLFIAISTLA
jgi:hypothetical protein